MQKNILQYAEWHDAEIGEISILAGGKLEFIFEHMSSYHQMENGKVEVWSSRAVVLLTGVIRFTIDGIIAEDDYVTEGELRNTEGKKVRLTAVEVEKHITSLSLLLAGSGTKIEVFANTVNLVTLKPLEKLEDWKGQLSIPSE